MGKTVTAHRSSRHNKGSLPLCSAPPFIPTLPLLPPLSLPPVYPSAQSRERWSSVSHKSEQKEKKIKLISSPCFCPSAPADNCPGEAGVRFPGLPVGPHHDQLLPHHRSHPGPVWNHSVQNPLRDPGEKTLLTQGHPPVEGWSEALNLELQ